MLVFVVALQQVLPLHLSRPSKLSQVDLSIAQLEGRGGEGRGGGGRGEGRGEGRGRDKLTRSMNSLYVQS